MTTKSIVIYDKNRLDTLAETVNREYTLAYDSAVQALEHAIACGEALIEARTLVPDGQWVKWVKENLNINTGTMHRFIRLATYKDELGAAERKPTSINAAIGYLKQIDVPAARSNRNGRKPTFDVEEAKRLHKQGLTYKRIGEILGVSDVAIAYQLNPDAPRKKHIHNARYKQRRNEERKALEKATVAKQVAKTGGAVAEAYSLIRRAEAALEQAQKETKVPNRLSLKEAMSHLHKAEDAVVAALKKERES